MLDFHLRVLIQNFFYLHLDLSMRPFIMSRHHLHHQNIVKLSNTEPFGAAQGAFNAFAFLRMVQCREKLLHP